MKKFLLISWGAGFVSFLLAAVLGLGAWQIGAVVGLFNATIAAPIIIHPYETSKKQLFLKVLHLVKNIVLSLVLTYTIFLIWSIAQDNLFIWDLEPISFGLAYGLLHTSVIGLCGIFYTAWSVIKDKDYGG